HRRQRGHHSHTHYYLSSHVHYLSGQYGEQVKRPHPRSPLSPSLRSGQALGRGGTTEKPPHHFLVLGDAGAIGSATSEFEMACTIRQRPFSFTQRTIYLPESAAGAPGGRLAPAGQAKFQRPSSSARGPWAQTDSARRSEEHTS